MSRNRPSSLVVRFGVPLRLPRTSLPGRWAQDSGRSPFRTTVGSFLLAGAMVQPPVGVQVWTCAGKKADEMVGDPRRRDVLGSPDRPQRPLRNTSMRRDHPGAERGEGRGQVLGVLPVRKRLLPLCSACLSISDGWPSRIGVSDPRGFSSGTQEPGQNRCRLPGRVNRPGVRDPGSLSAGGCAVPDS